MNNRERTTSGWFVRAYTKYEDIVSMGLTGLIAVIVLIAFIRLTVDVYQMLVIGMLDPLDHKVFKHIFGMIMTLLIAMEFKHSIVKVIERKNHVVQVKTVLLIALLALSRKFIILDLDIKTMNPGSLAALALSVLALGVVYRLIREDNRTGTDNLNDYWWKNKTGDGKNFSSISGNEE